LELQKQRSKQAKETRNRKKFAGHVFVYEFKDPATTRENNCVVSTQVRVDACATNFPAAGKKQIT
jgi:hypothetical protein